MSDPLRVYFDPAEIDGDGYPYNWSRPGWIFPGDDPRIIKQTSVVPNNATVVSPAIKDLIRERDGHRCLRCGHPYRKGEHGNGEWSPCDERCTHGLPMRVLHRSGGETTILRHETGLSAHRPAGALVAVSSPHGEIVEAQWRILTVHHLNGIKHDCRWWNLAALCQRCHLSVQTRVVMDREYDRPHSEWFAPFAAAWYAVKYLGEELTREQVDERLDELLELELRQERLPGLEVE